MSTMIPAGRMQLSALASKQYMAMFRLSSAIDLDRGLRALIDIRASQVNGCAFCIDMHWKDARAAGEAEERLYMLGAWRESPLYSDRERAALALCEAMTNLQDGRVTDETWVQADRAFDDHELSQLVFAITVINAWNRLMITSRAQPGHYRAGQFKAGAARATSTTGARRPSRTR
jgi:AhpD family alkylhydroperoxidase